MKTICLFKRTSGLLSLCIFLGGSIVLIGWIFDIPVLKSILPEFVAMKANTAICFMLIGMSLWLSQEKRSDNRLCREIARFCAFLVFLIGFLTFCEYMLGWNLGIDQLLFKEPADAILTSAPGRMAFNTSISFLILGLALLMAEAKTVIFSYLAQFLIILVGAIVLLSFVGYLYGASPLYIGLHFSTAMALHTTVLFLMTCMGCLFARPQRGLMKDVSSDSFGGIMLRRILPAVIFVPLVLGGFKIYGEHTKWFSNEFGVSFVSICNLLIISFFVYILSVYLNRLDAKHKAATEAMQEKTAFFEAQVESSLDGILVVDDNGKRILTNKQLLDIWKVPEEIRCQPIDEALLQYVVSKTKYPDQFLAKVRYLYEHPNETSRDEIEFKDGTIFDRYSAGVFGKTGRNYGRIWTFRDITERKRAEERVRESEEKYKTLYESSKDAIVILSPEKGFLHGNYAAVKLFGCKNIEGLASKTPVDLSPQYQPDGISSAIKAQQVVAAAIKEGSHFFEWTHKRIDGTEFSAAVLLTKIELKGQTLFQSTIRDITDYKNAEKALIRAKIQAEAANKAKSQFLANMSHEIRTPMAAIMGFSDILLEEELTDQQKAYVNTISNSGRHLLQVINDILDFSKIEAGKLDVEKNECSLENLLAVIESMIYPSVVKKGLQFEILADSGLPVDICTDSARVQQCLINLVNNAVKFTAKGHVTIHTSLENKNNQPCIRFDVEDTGIGIPADKQQKIFEPFIQANEDTSRKYGGTGLGLTITKQLAKLLGGELTLTSEEGKGSVFSLVIPAGLDALKQRQPSILPEPEEKRKLKETKYSGRVLVVEDNPTNQLLAETLLAKLGLQFVLACDGAEAVEKAAAESFDLILMDIQMPNMNGYEATRMLRKKGLKTPIVALTAHAMEGDRQKCIDAGCDDHMAKPINKTRLLEVLDRYLNSRSDLLTDKVEKLCEETKELTDICRQTQSSDKSQPDKPAGTSSSK